MTLEFSQNFGRTGERTTHYYTFDLTAGVKLVNEAGVVRSDKLLTNDPWIGQGTGTVAYRNGKLYLAQPFIDRRDPDNDKLFTTKWPKVFLVEVYRGSSLLYEGELLTDQQQDYNRSYPSFNKKDYRSFTHVKFQSPEQEGKP
ncbi:hypothetical protein [Gorillibacterium timonense]|uniref:hypothetical protein n=1 Tax=Gorillibacterium timonense TaxID=1689269 RepID=UPI00071D2138|nr:hypothetical protein [Gorillibacterium timonense]